MGSLLQSQRWLCALPDRSPRPHNPTPRKRETKRLPAHVAVTWPTVDVCGRRGETRVCRSPAGSPENTGEKRETPGRLASASHITPGSHFSQPELLVAGPRYCSHRTDRRRSNTTREGERGHCSKYDSSEAGGPVSPMQSRPPHRRQAQGTSVCARCAAR